ncbi:MAG: hypothetical protein OXF24_06325 [Hyphomicrobiales bacterium]|nr:hypothetical protein [Hyphomicrobiales bacterium]MCY4049182.1 hypothetical protein [Hyphomicrobiales bacterium]MCY4052636.1 hypothetical protein [Hyphomicrobiales bacterium]
MNETPAQAPSRDAMLAYRARQKRRNIITAILLGGMVALFFLATIVRLGENVRIDRFSGG